jgi:hypothetical protein
MTATTVFTPVTSGRGLLSLRQGQQGASHVRTAILAIDTAPPLADHANAQTTRRQSAEHQDGGTKNRDGRLFKFAEVDEAKAAIDVLWARHEALERQGILTPLVFCRRKGQRTERSGSGGRRRAGWPAARAQ